MNFLALHTNPKEDKSFISRVNLFLVTESLLFISFATLLIKDNLNIYIIGFVGIIVTIIYWFIFIMHVINIDKLKNALKDIYPNYKKKKYEIMIKGYANPLLGYVLPMIFLFAWIALLIVNTY